MDFYFFLVPTVLGGNAYESMNYQNIAIAEWSPKPKGIGGFIRRE
jgi:hypothetical protein